MAHVSRASPIGVLVPAPQNAPKSGEGHVRKTALLLTATTSLSPYLIDHNWRTTAQSTALASLHSDSPFDSLSHVSGILLGYSLPSYGETENTAASIVDEHSL